MARSSTAAIALGSNQGDRHAILRAALDALAGTPGVVSLRASPVVETPPVGGPIGQPGFLNAAAVVETTLSPAELYAACQRIEADHQRQRGLKDGPRTLDLDLLLHDDQVIDTPGLIVPHPRMHERRFVLEPLTAVAPLMIHPNLGRTVTELLAALPTTAPSGALAGQRILVTGSTSGIGRAIALACAQAGARVIVHGRRSSEAAASVAADAAALGGEAYYHLADVSDPAAAAELVATAWNCWGGLDGAVLNAGADVLTGPAAKWPFERKLEALWAVDVRATMGMGRDLGQRLFDAGGGWLQTLGWDQADTGMDGDSGQLFAAAKGAVMAFSRSLAATLAPRVRVNCVAPGWVKTAWGDTAPAAWQERVMRETPLKRWGTPADIAAAAVWLASPAAAFVTGQTVRVNGGAVRN